MLVHGSGHQKPQESNQSEQVSNQSAQTSNQVEQVSNQEKQVSNQILQISKGTDDSITDSFNYLSPKEPAIMVVDHPDELPITTTMVATTTPTTTTPTTTTTTTSTIEFTTSAETDDDTDDNTCSNGTNSDIFFEIVEIFDNGEIDCSNEFDAEIVEYPSCAKAFATCKENNNCIAVTSTNLIIIAPKVDSVKLKADADTDEIVNFMLPDEFDFDHDRVFVKKCFSTRETDTDQFTELETLDCNAEVVCSPGYRQKNFDCIDINECKLDHDCSFEGKASLKITSTEIFIV